MKYLICTTLLLVHLIGAAAQGATSTQSMQTELQAIQQEWAIAMYQIPAGDRRVQAFAALEDRAARFVAEHADRAEPLIWHGIVLSAYAGAKGGLGALGLAKRARHELEAALKIDPTALSGSAYTSLGALYYKVPGFPLGFGNKTKAREHLERALAIDPTGIDANFFYADFLLEGGEPKLAAQYLQRAKNAPPRLGRELADAGRRDEIEALLTKLGPSGQVAARQ